MFPNMRLMVAAVVASVVALSCGFGVFAAFRVNHEPLGRLQAGDPRFVVDNAVTPAILPAAAKFGSGLQSSEQPAAQPIADVAVSPTTEPEQPVAAQQSPPQNASLPIPQSPTSGTDQTAPSASTVDSTAALPTVAALPPGDQTQPGERAAPEMQVAATAAPKLQRRVERKIGRRLAARRRKAATARRFARPRVAAPVQYSGQTSAFPASNYQAAFQQPNFQATLQFATRPARVARPTAAHRAPIRHRRPTKKVAADKATKVAAKRAAINGTVLSA
jgi:hypothetical protein